MIVAITNVVSTLHPSGITVFIFELSNALLQEGHEVYVISGGEVIKKVMIKDMFEVDRIPKIFTLEEIKAELYSPKFNITTLKTLLLWAFKGNQILKKIAPDIVISNGAIPIYSSALKVAVCHDLEFREFFQKPYNKIFYRQFNVIAATSTELARQAPANLGVNPNKVITIPTCIDISKYRSLPWEERENAILHVGTWFDKNLETTLKAFCRVAYTDPSIKLYIVGDLWKRPRMMLSKVKKDFLRRIHCVGRIPKKELRHLFAKVKVTSVPSIYKIPVLSPTVLESLAAGTPVIGGSTAISNDLLIDGHNGFRIRCTDDKALSEKILELIQNNELWTKFSINARTVAKLFDARIIAKKYVALYEALNAMKC